ncbi:hypothetical protein [Actinomadura kijaniata]|uniref:hypothetical protein n=1 Tax=Actinomadura kijaniata TaxID=46161 RepID=UPI00082DC702|nr:hypothetical protein [Actinomadura kijaniata]
MRLLSITALGAALVATGLASTVASEATAAAGGRVTVTPSVAAAGQRVELRVPNCSVGPKRHWARSKAFTSDVTLGGKGDAGVGTATLKRKLTAGTYKVTAYCGGRTATGKIRVVGKGAWPSLLPSPLGPPASPAP